MTSCPVKTEEGGAESASSVESSLLRVVIPFDNPDQAQIALNSLRVDREPKRSQVKKTLAVEKHCLILELVGPDARSLRLSSNSFFDHLALVQKTIDKFSLEKYNKSNQGKDFTGTTTGQDFEAVQPKKACLYTTS